MDCPEFVTMHPRASGCGSAGAGGPTGSVPVSKSYNELVKCNESASALTSDLEANFASFANYSGTFDGAPTTLTFAPPSGGISVGTVIPITTTTLLPLIGSPFVFPYVTTTSVTVTQADATSFTFTADPGHPLAGSTISFTAQDMGSGSVGFSVVINGQTAGALNSLAFQFGGSAFEDGVWNHLLDQVIADCSKKH
jgi:hypothetical protein